MLLSAPQPTPGRGQAGGRGSPGKTRLRRGCGQGCRQPCRQLPAPIGAGTVARGAQRLLIGAGTHPPAAALPAAPGSPPRPAPGPPPSPRCPGGHGVAGAPEQRSGEGLGPSAVLPAPLLPTPPGSRRPPRPFPLPPPPPPAGLPGPRAGGAGAALLSDGRKGRRGAGPLRPSLCSGRGSRGRSAGPRARPSRAPRALSPGRGPGASVPEPFPRGARRAPLPLPRRTPACRPHPLRPRPAPPRPLPPALPAPQRRRPRGARRSRPRPRPPRMLAARPAARC